MSLGLGVHGLGIYEVIGFKVEGNYLLSRFFGG